MIAMGRKRQTLQDIRINQRIGQRLRQLRELEKKNQTDIASVVGVDRASVSQWESGKNLFSLSRLPKVAMAYGVPDVSEFVRFLFSPENGGDDSEDVWRVGTGMVVRVGGFYACEYCGDVRYFKSAVIAPKCYVCGETVWKRQVLW
jgi:DNA-binding XRE family transcriptional regulator